ncbi:hypothetical protein EVJ50_03975 [Synechococcus sp. RSCCF101]|nr:hypothetical protein EVJ50_03975 [Synechococcus sp. RSCCF101]
MFSSALLLSSIGAAIAPPSRAEVLVRAQGRCKLVSGGLKDYNGHCLFKHKAAGGSDVFVVRLDDGSNFVFRGPNTQALSVQTYSGIRNVRHKAERDHDVFIWDDEGERRRLSVRLDHVQNPDVTFEDEPQQASTGALVGAAVGALIGNLIGGGDSSTSTSRSRESASVGAPVGELQDLVGRKGGQAEPNLVRRGYIYRGGSTGISSKFSFWEQPGTGNCVGIETSDGRYQKIVYADRSSCD